MRTAMRADQHFGGVSGFNVPACMSQAVHVINGYLPLEMVRVQVARLAVWVRIRLAEGFD